MTLEPKPGTPLTVLNGVRRAVYRASIPVMDDDEALNLSQDDIANLVDYLEEELPISIPLDELSDHLHSITTVSRFLARLLRR